MRAGAVVSAPSPLSEVLRATASDMADQALATMRGGPLLAVSPTRSRDILFAYFMMTEEIIATIEGAAVRGGATDMERTQLSAVAFVLREMYGKGGAP